MSEKGPIETGMIGADTSFIIDFLKGEEKAVRFMKENSRHIRINELVIYEFLCGNLDQKNLKVFFEFIQMFSHNPFNRESAVLAGELFRDARKRGKTIGHADCMIAGSYLSNGISRIASRNVNHFMMMRGIKVIRY